MKTYQYQQFLSSIGFLFSLQADTFSKVIQSDSDDRDERAIAAMGILNTLDTIVTVMEEQPAVSDY